MRSLLRFTLVTALLASMLVIASASTASASHTISSFSPPAGTMRGDVQLTINGSGFKANSSVSLVSGTVVVAGTIENYTASRLTVGFPTTGTRPGNYTVRVTDPGPDGIFGNEDDDVVNASSTYLVQNSIPKVDSFTPDSGTRGTTVDVTVRGANLSKNGSFTFADSSSPVPSGNEITVTNYNWQTLGRVVLTLDIPSNADLIAHNVTYSHGTGASNSTVTKRSAFVVDAAVSPNVPDVTDAYFHNGSGGNQTTTTTNEAGETAVPITVEATKVGDADSDTVITLIGADEANAGIQIQMDIETVTPGFPPGGLVPHEFDGVVDLANRAPGTYNVRVKDTRNNGSSTVYEAGLVLITPEGRPVIDTPKTTEPVIAPYNRTTAMTVTGSQFFERIQFTSNEPSLEFSGINVISDTEVEVSVTTTSETPNGNFDFTVTNTDGQSRTCPKCIRQRDRSVGKYLWQIRYTPTAGNPQLEVTLGDENEVPIACDWNGDGIDTMATFNLSTRVWTLYKKNITGSEVLARFAYGRPGDSPLCGDWDGDGDETVAVYRGNIFYFRNTNSGGVADNAIGYGRGSHQGDAALVGDWDGNGTDTLGIRRGNKYYLRNSNTTGVADLSYGYGKATDVPVTGDFNGNGVDSPGVRRGNRFLLRTSNTSGNANFDVVYGNETQIPIIADFNGNGFDDLAVLDRI